MGHGVSDQPSQVCLSKGPKVSLINAFWINELGHCCTNTSLGHVPVVLCHNKASTIDTVVSVSVQMTFKCSITGQIRHLAQVSSLKQSSKSRNQRRLKVGWPTLLSKSSTTDRKSLCGGQGESVPSDSQSTLVSGCNDNYRR